MAELKNRKHENFCREFLADINAGKAAERAGYSPGNSARVQGNRLLNRPEVQARIALLMHARREGADIDAAYVLDKLRTIVDRCMQAEEVLDRGGDPIGEWRFNASGANKALELLGRHLGLWNDKLSLQVTEAKARELLERAAGVIVRHVKDQTVLAAIRAEFADLMGGGDA